MKKIEKAMAKAVNTVINIESFGWPPVCHGSIYQPPRPQARPKKAGENSRLRGK